MLYTGKGDKGTTKLFNCEQGVRISKSDYIFEVLGTFDELNTTLGYTKVLAKKAGDTLTIQKNKTSYEDIIETLQQNIFCLQAEIGGAPIHVTHEHVTYLEKVIYEIETLLPPINSFIVAGGSEAGAYLDIARTQARRAERCLVTLKQKKEKSIQEVSIIYMNRLSSALYALARFANYQEGYTEQKPHYQ